MNKLYCIPLKHAWNREQGVTLQLSFSELNSIESTESMEFVEDNF